MSNKRKNGDKRKNQDNLEDMAMALYIHAAELLKEGKSPQAVERQLVRQGVDPATAHTILERLAHSQDNVMRQQGYRNLFIGAVVMGIAIILLTNLLLPAVVGGVRIVVVGVLLCGLYAFGRGLLQILSADLPHDQTDDKA